MVGWQAQVSQQARWLKYAAAPDGELHGALNANDEDVLNPGRTI